MPPIRGKEEKTEEFGEDALDGHDVEALYNAFVARDDKPRLIIAETIKGKGVSFMENNKYWHHGTLSEEQYNQAKKELEG